MHHLKIYNNNLESDYKVHKVGIFLNQGRYVNSGN